MTDQKLFRLEATSAVSLKSSSDPLEKPLQRIFEKNLYSLLGVHFLATEFLTGKQHGGRIDSLGVDENGCPVILEYKAKTDENVINQGLFYLNWLMDHRGDFQMLVDAKLKESSLPERFKEVPLDFSGTRVICIASDFTKYDVHAVQQINRNIELIRYKRFGNELLFLELVNGEELSQPNADGATSAMAELELQASSEGSPLTRRHNKTVSQYLTQATADLSALYEALDSHLRILGEDVQVKVNMDYVAYRRLRNFACVEVRPSDKHLLLYLKVDPSLILLEEGFSRDVREIGHFGTGDLELRLRAQPDLEKAKAFIQQSYEAS